MRRTAIVSASSRAVGAALVAVGLFAMHPDARAVLVTLCGVALLAFGCGCRDFERR